MIKFEGPMLHQDSHNISASIVHGIVIRGNDIFIGSVIHAMQRLHVITCLCLRKPTSAAHLLEGSRVVK